MPSIFLTTHKIANERGAACGRWIDPTVDDIAEALAAIGAEHGDPMAEEPMIADHEDWCGLNPEDFGLDALPDLAALIEEDDDRVKVAVEHYGAHYFRDVDGLREAVDNLSIYADADEMAEDLGVLDEIPEHLRFYFDTERWAHAATLNGDASELADGRYVVARR